MKQGLFGFNGRCGEARLHDLPVGSLTRASAVLPQARADDVIHWYEDCSTRSGMSLKRRKRRLTTAVSSSGVCLRASVLYPFLFAAIALVGRRYRGLATTPMLPFDRGCVTSQNVST